MSAFIKSFIQSRQDHTIEAKQLFEYGCSLVGKTCQSTLLTMISPKGGKIHEPAQKITGCQIVYVCDDPQLMLTVGGEDVYEDTCFNFSK